MDDIQKANPAARKRSIVIVLVVVGIGACALALFERNKVELAEWLVANLEASSYSGGLIVASITFLFTPFLAVVIYIFLFGRRIVAARRFPPPGHSVVRDTRIVDGRAAVIRGRFLQLFSLAITLTLALAILLLVYFIHDITGET